MILVISPKNIYASRRLKYEREQQNADCEILDVEDLVKINFQINPKKYYALYIRSPYLKASPKYIPKIIDLAKNFKKAGKKVVDENIALGDLGKGKWRDYQKLKKANISIPKTELVFNYKSKITNLKSCIIKWIFGMKAKGTFLFRSQKDFKKVPSFIPRKELMLQEYIEADYEYKVVTVGYKALPVVLRFGFNKKLGRVEFSSAASINWRHPERSEGSSPKGASLDSSSRQSKTQDGTQNDAEKVAKLAERASKTLGRELAKVDILQKDKKFYVLEVNRFPGLKSFEEKTKANVFKKFLEYLQK